MRFRGTLEWERRHQIKAYPLHSGSSEHHDWPNTYYNYFTEIEEHFQRARGTALFLLSPLDWALIETWKNAGIPLEAVLRGIDSAFEKWRSRKSRIQQVNSLAYCSQAVMKEAQQLLDRDAGAVEPAPKAKRAPFTQAALVRYLSENAQALNTSPQEAIQALGSSLAGLAANAAASEADLSDLDVEDLERHLSSLEEKLLAHLRLAQRDDEMVALRRDLDAQLRPYRSKMNAEQLRQLEEQYLSRRLLEKAGLPRLSLFYMTDYGV